MKNSFGSQGSLRVSDQTYTIYRLAALEKKFPESTRLPYSLKILLENLLRTEDGKTVRSEDIEALAHWQPKAEPSREIAFTPSRVLMQDFTGVPAVVDLAAMRDAIKKLAGDPRKSTPSSRPSWSSTTPCRWTISQTRGLFTRMSTWNTIATKSDMLSCAGAKNPFAISKLYRPAPASATRSTWSIWGAWYSRIIKPTDRHPWA